MGCLWTVLKCRLLGPNEEWGRGSAFISSPQVEWMLLTPDHTLGSKGVMERNGSLSWGPAVSQALRGVTRSCNQAEMCPADMAAPLSGLGRSAQKCAGNCL